MHLYVVLGEEFHLFDVDLLQESGDLDALDNLGYVHRELCIALFVVIIFLFEIEILLIKNLPLFLEPLILFLELAEKHLLLDDLRSVVISILFLLLGILKHIFVRLCSCDLSVEDNFALLLLVSKSLVDELTSVLSIYKVMGVLHPLFPCSIFHLNSLDFISVALTAKIEFKVRNFSVNCTLVSQGLQDGVLETLLLVSKIPDLRLIDVDFKLLLVVLSCQNQLLLLLLGQSVWIIKLCLPSLVV